MNIQTLEKILTENKQPRFRLEQIRKAIYQDGVSSFLEITTIPKDLRNILERTSDVYRRHQMSTNGILFFEVENILISSDKDSIKALLKLEDGKKIETVLISPKPGLWSACISSQVGCPMNCAFCATGEMGFKRNLTYEEIADQVLFWKQYLRKNKITGRFSNIVYMGMGEPFLNWGEVKESLKILTDKKYFNFGSRSISISTIGIPGGIEKLIADFPQINLAVSLHFTDNKARSWHMPGNIIFDLDKLKIELEKYFERCNRKVFLEYILFFDLNDSKESAQSLIKYIKSFKKPYLLHVNLIRYNETSKKFKHSSFDQTQKFKDYLVQNGISATIRKSLGTDIQGACGQLAQH